MPASGTRGMVASAHPEASAAGVEILRAGGNAVDAAVATAFALAVVEPYSSGLGGGGFALVRVGTTLSFLDFREVAPAAASRDMYLVAGKADAARSRDGILAAAVPGAVLGYLSLHERSGKLPRERILLPAIRLAEAGFLVDARYRDYVDWRLDALRADPEATRIFLVDGQAPPLGHRVVQKDLTKTLRTLAKEGAPAFYRGRIAQLLVRDMQTRGGIVSAADLERFAVRERVPLVGSFRGMAVVTAPPPSAGGQVLLTLLNGLEALPKDVRRADVGALHLYVEVAKRAFADRHLIGDPAFVAAPLEALISKTRARAIVGAIGERAKPATKIGPAEKAELPAGTVLPRVVADPGGGNDTTHLSVIDAEGNAVALTTTVNYGWGACVVARGTGILWNDEMDDFASAPGAPNAYGVVGAEVNAIAPGKVPVSSMAPTMVFAGATTNSPLRLIVGSPGGPRIPTTIVQIILNHLVFGADIEQAVSLGRVHHQHLPDVVAIEPLALDPETVRAMAERGHKVEEQEPWSNATAIAIDPATQVRTGSADRRSFGIAIAE